MPEPQTNTDPIQYDPDPLFSLNGPVNPICVDEAVRTLIRALPLGDTAEPSAWAYRRMFAAMQALAALHPRDEIEIMLGVQALSAYHAAAANWRIGMNLRRPHGDSTRHVTTAASAARTFDTLLKAIERRQAKPLALPPGYPPPREWPPQNPAAFMIAQETRLQHGQHDPEPERPAPPLPTAEWTPDAIALAHEIIEQDRIEDENRGLDIANTEGIRPDGSIIMPEDPTPQQEAYIARRLGLAYKREYAENLRNGSKKLPKIRPLRTGDLVP
jgi:hypothetical protein